MKLTATTIAFALVASAALAEGPKKVEITPRPTPPTAGPIGPQGPAGTNGLDGASALALFALQFRQPLKGQTTAAISTAGDQENYGFAFGLRHGISSRSDMFGAVAVDQSGNVYGALGFSWDLN